MATANEDPYLGRGPSEDSEILLDDSDSGSVLSDDSVLPDYERNAKHTEPAKTLYEACARNDPTSMCSILERGVTKEEAMELDINGRVRNISFFLSFIEQSKIHTFVQQKNSLIPCQNGLMLAVAKGFVDIVTLLHTCKSIDINHQDNDGNTAIMIAAQAGTSEDIYHSTSTPNPTINPATFFLI